MSVDTDEKKTEDVATSAKPSKDTQDDVDDDDDDAVKVGIICNCFVRFERSSMVLLLYCLNRRSYIYLSWK